MGRAHSKMTRVQARVTLVAGKPLAPVTIAPGDTLDLPINEAERLILQGYAVPVPEEDASAAGPVAADSQTGTAASGASTDGSTSDASDAPLVGDGAGASEGNSAE